MYRIADSRCGCICVCLLFLFLDVKLEPAQGAKLGCSPVIVRRVLLKVTVVQHLALADG